MLIKALCCSCIFVGANKGIPNLLMARNNQAKPIDESLVPAVNEAVAMYESNGGSLSLSSDFGRDPLAERQDLMSLRIQKFKERYPSFSTIFHGVANHDSTLFRNGLLYFIDVSMQLTTQL